MLLKYPGRAVTITRILSVIVVCTVTWLWLGQDIGPTPQIVFEFHNHQEPPPPAFVVNASCDNVKPAVKATKLSQTLFPISNPEKSDSWVGENNKMLRALFRCMELSNCGPNQKKVVILGSFHFLGAFWGWVGGENIWARSTIQALRDMGYTYLYTKHMEQTIQLYHMMPDLVKAILVEGDGESPCFKDDENCILSPRNPDGIPAWKIFAFHFWTGPSSPLGRNWTLSPEPYALEGHNPNTYLGYSVEPSCMLQPFVPHADREHRGYIMTKRLAFFEPGGERAWPPHFFEAASNATGIHFVMGAQTDIDPPTELPNNVTNYGPLSQPAFMDALSKSLVLVGVGRPVASPTPYDSLCLGVPFINPILDWDRNNPKDRKKWSVQHGLLKFLDPPYVYNVYKDDFDGFVKAIENIVAHPIERHILDRMKMSAVTARLREILETDWKSEAAELMVQRKATGEGPIFTI